MYSRNRSYTEPSEMALPARYSGVRFRRDKRSDGRGVVIEAPLREISPAVIEKKEDIKEEIQPPAEKPCDRPLSSFLSNVAEDDILLAALIIVLAAEGADTNREAILLLILLLCVK